MNHFYERRCRSISLLFLAALIAGHKSPVRAQDNPTEPVKLGSLPGGKLGESLLRMINEGDQAARTKFIQTSFTSAALKDTPLDEYRKLFEKLRLQSGGLDAARIADTSPNMLVFDVRSRKEGHVARMVLVLDKQEPGKLADFMIMPGARSELLPPFPLPKTKLSDAELIKEIERRVERLTSLDELSGVVLVAKGDRPFFHKAYGFANQDFQVPNRLDTKFHLGSMGKMFTSVAIAQLVASGKLDFGDKLEKVLPDYPSREVASKITIEQLLMHRAGLGDIFKPAFYEHRERYRSPRDYFQLFANEPLRFEPGSRWSYSNAGYVVLGAVIEKLSGKSYFDYVRENIFEPAGMKDTGAYELTQVTPNRAVGYLRDAAEDPLGLEPRRSNLLFVPFKGVSCGGGYSTALDLLRFASWLKSYKFLSREMTEKIVAGKSEYRSPFGPAKYGYGFVTETFGGKEVRGHGGGGANSGIDSELAIFWDGSYTVIVLGNYDAPAAARLTHQLCDLLATQ
jgi:CubicO group peptidase (beta-lactamase class C family)